MQALYFLGNRKLEVWDVPDPKPGAGQVVIKMKSAGVCGSDLHFYRPEESTPFIQGHEGAGIVHELGEGVTDFNVGDRVAIYHWVTCGRCYYCLSGFLMQCPDRKGMCWHTDGVDADYYLTEPRYLMRLPEELNFLDGSMIACGGGTAYSVVRKIALSADTSFVVFGLGPLGLAVLQIAKGFGAKIIGVDVVPERLEIAQKLGADIVINSQEVNIVEELLKLTGGFGVQRIIEISGNPHARADAVEAAAPNARLGFVGMRHNENFINFDHFIRKQLTLIGSYVFPITMYPEIRDFLINYKIHFSDIATGIFSLQEAEKVYQLFDKGSAGKYFFVWD